MLKKTLTRILLPVLLAASAGVANAGVVTYEGVTFTSSLTGNELTLEIDAAHPSGTWAGATSIGGNFSFVNMSSFTMSLPLVDDMFFNFTLDSAALASGGPAATFNFFASQGKQKIGTNMLMTVSAADEAPSGDVPEPLSAALLLGGLSAMGLLRRGKPRG